MTSSMVFAARRRLSYQDGFDTTVQAEQSNFQISCQVFCQCISALPVCEQAYNGNAVALLLLKYVRREMVGANRIMSEK